MGIAIIAEGIEREEELAKVSELGIAYAQGYLLGRPAAFQ
jgi:EAL domain-containing protein (putative c-di-GMP-specific phosphodiesterase class I)